MIGLTKVCNCNKWEIKEAKSPFATFRRVGCCDLFPPTLTESGYVLTLLGQTLEHAVSTDRLCQPLPRPLKLTMTILWQSHIIVQVTVADMFILFSSNFLIILATMHEAVLQ